MVIATDFDGILCTVAFPQIGKPNIIIIKLLKNARLLGHKVILWTCREGQFLEDAIIWCKKYGLTFDAVNENVPEFKNQDFAIRKIYADVYLDDRCLSIDQFSYKYQEFFDLSQ
jgi:hypothetical protein